MIVEALDFQTDRELLVIVTFASADRFDVCLLRDRGCHTSPTLEPTSRFRIPPLGKNSPLPICLALLELTIADLSQTMESKAQQGRTIVVAHEKAQAQSLRISSRWKIPPSSLVWKPSSPRSLLRQPTMHLPRYLNLSNLVRSELALSFMRPRLQHP